MSSRGGRLSASHTIGAVPATILAVAVGGALGLGVERGVVRRLRQGSATAQTVGTVGVLGLLIAFAVRVWGTTPQRGVDLFPEKSFSVGNSVLHLGDIGLLVSAVLPPKE